MGRASIKENKNIYQTCREELKLTREKASELLEFISPDRIEKIESEKSPAHPDEVLQMSKAYKAPQLCNYYCSNDCPIGRVYVPEIKQKDLSQIVLQILASLNSVEKQRERLIGITADGEITDDEVEDFVGIKDELEKISETVSSLRLWTEQMIANNKISEERIEAVKNNRQ